MSLVSPSALAFQSIYRLVSPTINVKHGTLSANSKFATNVPFDYAMLIYEIEWGIAVKDQMTPVTSVWQVTAELTEATNLTTASNTDVLMIDDTFYEERDVVATSVGLEVWGRNPFQQHRRNFLLEFGGTYPTVAQNLNVVASMVEPTGSGPATNGVDVFANIWYTLATVTPSLRDYLTKRQQLQR